MDKLDVKLRLEDIVSSPNVADKLTDQQLDIIGKTVVDEYRKDESSRAGWLERMSDAVKLALQVAEHKSFPWPNCSNVKFPLLTIAALQFLARVSVLTKGRNLVKMEVIGNDPKGEKSAKGKRISTHMSLQLTESPVNWVDHDEQVKLTCAIMGSAFKKSYYDNVTGDQISEHVPAEKIVLDYFTKDINRANRITHVVSMTPNAIQERERRGLFVKMCDGDPSSADVNVMTATNDELSGMTRPDDSLEFEILEQHRWIDLDGDGYEEPYIVSVRKDTGQTLRIVARFFDEGDVYRLNDPEVQALTNQIIEAGDNMEMVSTLEKRVDALEKDPKNKIIRIEPVQYFTRYIFIPSPDGGVYGLGLGALLGPVNSSVDTLINQLIDAGTMSIAAGGFLGRGIKMKGGSTSFSPFEWKTVDSVGGDIQKNMVPLPVREPSAVLFQLLGTLITYGEKISGATDIMTGISPGQNTPAETSRNTVEQGMMLFSGIYARMYRSFREELKKLYNLNRLYIKTSPKFYELSKGPDAIIAPDDYDSQALRIFPAASPEAVSAAQRREKVMMLKQNAATTPGYDKALIERMWLEEFGYDDIDRIYRPQEFQPPPNPKMVLEEKKLQQAAQEHQDEMQLAVAELQGDLMMIDAKILELEAKAKLHASQADGVKTGHLIAIFDAQIGAARARREGLIKALDTMSKHNHNQMKLEMESKQNGNNGSGSKGMGAPSGNAGVPRASEGG